MCEATRCAGRAYALDEVITTSWSTEDVFAKTATATAFVGTSTGGQSFKTSTDDASFTSDS